MKQTIELMRKRHAHWTHLIQEYQIRTAEEFYNRLNDYFEIFCVELSLSDNKKCCRLTLNMEDYDYEDYYIFSGENGASAKVDSEVSWKNNYCVNEDIDIFKVDELDNPWTRIAEILAKNAQKKTNVQRNKILSI